MHVCKTSERKGEEFLIYGMQKGYKKETSKSKQKFII